MEQYRAVSKQRRRPGQLVELRDGNQVAKLIRADPLVEYLSLDSPSTLIRLHWKHLSKRDIEYQVEHGDRVGVKSSFQR